LSIGQGILVITGGSAPTVKAFVPNFFRLVDIIPYIKKEIEKQRQCSAKPHSLDNFSH
jgi:hypothetical protein